MRFIFVCLFVLFLVTGSYASIFGQIEEPDYEVLTKLTKSIEIRKYKPTKWVSTTLMSEANDNSRRGMFMKLFGYIRGQNNQSKKIEMTKPALSVYQNFKNEILNFSSNCNITMQFYVPKNEQPNTPVPTDETVKVLEMPELTVAVIRFGGYAKMKNWFEQRDQLIKQLGNEANNFDQFNMITAGYDAPFMFFNRRSEVWLVKK